MLLTKKKMGRHKKSPLNYSMRLPRGGEWGFVLALIICIVGLSFMIRHNVKKIKDKYSDIHKPIKAPVFVLVGLLTTAFSYLSYGAMTD